MLLSEHTVTRRHSVIIQTFVSWQLYIINLTVARHSKLPVQLYSISPTAGSYSVFYNDISGLFSHNLQVCGICIVAAFVLLARGL